METRCYGCMRIKQSRPECEHCGFDERSRNNKHQLPIGTEVGGQYILGRVLGQGGFGITYIAWDKVLKQRVAVKEYFPSGYAGRDTHDHTVTSYDDADQHTFDSNKRRFLREAESLAKLWSIPQIVKILRCFEENGTAYIAMEYVEGMDLRKHLKQLGRPMTMDEVLAILGPVMEALEQVHKANLVHRDISPDNIMVLPDGSAKLLDFGAARYVENANAEQDRNTSTQAILKHGFAPPEQYSSHGALGPWTDVYAMCATIYYCLTGRIPTEAMARVMEGEEIDWTGIRGLSEKQQATLKKGLEVQPKKRISSIHELRKALISTSGSMSVSESKAQSKKYSKKRRYRENQIIAVLSICIVMLLCLFIGIVFWDMEQKKQPLAEDTTAPVSEPVTTESVPDSNSGNVACTYESTEAGMIITGYTGSLPKEVILPKYINDIPVIEIGDTAFRGCKQLTSITIPEGIQTIGASAFSACPQLISVIIPDSITSIGDFAFSGCTKLEKINLSPNLNNIGICVFGNCKGLTNITIPGGIDTISDSTFKDCSNLQSVFILPNITRIDKNAFYGCVKLRQVIFPYTLEYIGPSAFSGCESLRNPTFPSSLKYIGDSAFSGCDSIISVTIPENIEFISNDAFWLCSNLEKIRIPKNCQYSHDQPYFIDKNGKLYKKEISIIVY